jgi:hypothetical protein
MTDHDIDYAIAKELSECLGREFKSTQGKAAFHDLFTNEEWDEQPVFDSPCKYDCCVVQLIVVKHMGFVSVGVWLDADKFYLDESLVSLDEEDFIAKITHRENRRTGYRASRAWRTDW